MPKPGQYEKISDKYLVYGENEPRVFTDQCSAMLYSRMTRNTKDDGGKGCRLKYDLDYIKDHKEDK